MGGHADPYKAWSKLQQLIDGGLPLLLQGHLQSMPMMRLRGLPFNCSDGDVFDFSAGLDVVDVLLIQKNGRFSREAFVVFGAPMQVDYTLQKNRHNMGRRLIEVFRSKKQDYYHAVATEVADAQCGDSLPLHWFNNSSGTPKTIPCNEIKDYVDYTGVLKLWGLPFLASKKDVIDFFQEFELDNENVHIVLHNDEQTIGEAFVDFGSANKAKSAMNKDKMTMGSCYVELFSLSREEARQAAIR